VKAKSFMVIAGETSGDILAAELVQAIRSELNREPIPTTWDYQPLETSLAPRFFGAGGPHLVAAGVDLTLDLTAHSVTGISEVLKNLGKFRRLLNQLYRAALEREPDAIICVDFSGFNRRFAHAIKQYVRSRSDWFHDWNPRIIQYVSPQVWASRASRVYQLAKDFDLLLSIFPFEREWYSARVPELRVEFVGHPVVDRYGPAQPSEVARSAANPGFPTVLLLPGSRPDELKRHLPVLVGALGEIRSAFPQLTAIMVLPNEGLLPLARAIGLPDNLQVQIGNLAAALRQVDLALASTGTVTIECAYFGVPTLALYKTSFLTWQIAKRIVTVKYAAMPNLLVNQELFPEFIQHAATPENIARASIELLRDQPGRTKIKGQLMEIVASLGPPGASKRASRAVLSTLKSRSDSSKFKFETRAQT
jgi:lipid-A-disaccharide synthase